MLEALAVTALVLIHNSSLYGLIHIGRRVSWVYTSVPIAALLMAVIFSGMAISIVSATGPLAVGLLIALFIVPATAWTLLASRRNADVIQLQQKAMAPDDASREMRIRKVEGIILVVMALAGIAMFALEQYAVVSGLFFSFVIVVLGSAALRRYFCRSGDSNTHTLDS